MVNRFYVISLVAIRLISTIAILDQNHYRNLGQQEKLVLQAAFIVNHIKSNNLCDFRAIIYHIVVSIGASDTICISDNCLNSQKKNVIEQKSIDMILSSQFRSRFFEPHVK